MTTPTDRVRGLAPTDRDEVERLIRVAVRGLGKMYRAETDIFAFTRTFTVLGDTLVSDLRGESLRYAAIVALGAHFLPEDQQRDVLGGHTVDAFVDRLVRHQGTATNLGDVALVAWAAAQADHPALPRALARLREVDTDRAPAFVVEAAWVVSALAAARKQADVEAHLAAARDRLLASPAPGSPAFPHATGPGLVRPYRAHVACFADQVYPIQALARLHHTADDPEALAAAEACARQIVDLQGDGGQWWWHYDARTGGVIEGYPVYTVHQHAMGPMALLDLADAGGTPHTEAIARGLRWIAAPAELGTGGETMVHEDEGLTVRKVYRGDPKKIVRGLHTLTTRVRPGLRVPGVNAAYRPTALDRECRPYEFGWLFFAWLGGLDAAAGERSSRLAEERLP